MKIKLSDYMLEQSISDSSVDDIIIEEACARLDVLIALTNNIIKEYDMDIYTEEANMPPTTPKAEDVKPAYVKPADETLTSNKTKLPGVEYPKTTSPYVDDSINSQTSTSWTNSQNNASNNSTQKSLAKTLINLLAGIAAMIGPGIAFAVATEKSEWNQIRRKREIAEKTINAANIYFKRVELMLRDENPEATGNLAANYCKDMNEIVTILNRRGDMFNTSYDDLTKNSDVRVKIEVDLLYKLLHSAEAKYVRNELNKLLSPSGKNFTPDIEYRLMNTLSNVRVEEIRSMTIETRNVAKVFKRIHVEKVITYSKK